MSNSAPILNIVVPMSGTGKRFQEAGYAFPKPLIDVGGRTMIDVVARNLRPSGPHRFIFVCLRDQYEKYNLHTVFKNATDGKFEVVLLSGTPEGAACTVLAAAQHIDTDEELVIANADQFLSVSMDDFIAKARTPGTDGLIMTFPSRHPRWSYARVGADGSVLETAEKKVISEHATVGIYYFKRGGDFVKAAQEMVHKNVRYNGEFYVCPAYNELILEGKHIGILEIAADQMHGLGTPEDVQTFQRKLEEGKVKV